MQQMQAEVRCESGSVMVFSNIIFDFDGTITDSKHDIAGAQLWVLEQLGVTLHSKEDLFPHIGKTLDETFTTLLPANLHYRIPDAAKMYSEYYTPRSLVNTTLFPGVKETLEELVLRGKRLAVASTKRGPGIKRATDHFGITDYFVQLQGSDGIPFKPDPFIINKILLDQQWKPEETLMVGDTDKDILVGKNAGLATCAVTYGSLTKEELERYDPDYIMMSFAELLSIV
ncbi:MAG: HAD-IA family hydrolase [Ignavibacteriae bacterium]|nr:HAD-IA family hydrolase [Ignavibacteriota bacterium]